MEITWGIISVILVTTGLTAVIIVGVTIHSRKIRESEFKFRTLFEKVFDALFLLNERGDILDVNDSACKLSGHSKKQLLKMKINRLLPSQFTARLRGIWASGKIGESVYLDEVELINKDKTPIYVEVGVILISIKGKIYTLASLRDIHARKLAEKDLEKKNIALKEILSHLEEEKKSFENGISEIVDNSLLPALKKIINKDGSANLAYLELIENGLQQLATSSGSALNTYSGLSPREVEICSLVKGGATSKEISMLLKITTITVNKHRENIRKKLHISNRDINLSTYLKEL